MNKFYGILIFAMLITLSVEANNPVAGELSIRVLNNTSGDLITVEYELISEAAWDAPVHTITTSYNSGSLRVS